MGWKGMAIGGCFGACLGPLGAALGAAIGHALEKQLEGTHGSPARRAGQMFGRAEAEADAARRRDEAFCAGVAAMLAKLAKADGRVSRSEIDAVENAFRRLGFSRAARACAIDAFRRAKDDAHTIYEYAQDFAAAVPSVEVRELVYELLWDVACADGTLDVNERTILRRVPFSLGVLPQWYEVFAATRMRRAAENTRRNAPPPPPPPPPKLDPYAVLGVAPSASDDELKRAYRAKAKKYHPDALRAQGLPEAMAAKATEMMAQINAAWDAVCRARGIR